MVDVRPLIDQVAYWVFAIVGGLLALMFVTYFVGVGWRAMRQAWRELWRPQPKFKSSKKQTMITYAPDGGLLLAGRRLARGNEVEIRAPSDHGAVWIVLQVEWRRDPLGNGPSWRLIGGDRLTNLPAVGQLARWPVVLDPKDIAELKTELRHCKYHCDHRGPHCERCDTHWKRKRLTAAGNTPEDVRQLL